MNKARVFLNGELVGTHDRPKELAAELRKRRRMGEIKKQVNIIYYEDTNEIIINSDQGRARRPAVIVENGKPLVTAEHIDRLKKGEIGFSIPTDLPKNSVFMIWPSRSAISSTLHFCSIGAAPPSRQGVAAGIRPFY